MEIRVDGENNFQTNDVVDKNLFDFIHTWQSRRHVEKSLPACHHVKKLFQTVVPWVAY